MSKKKTFYLVIFSILLILTILLVKSYVFAVKPEVIIILKTDLFKDMSSICLDDTLDDVKMKNLFSRKDQSDYDMFHIALFYSHLSMEVLDKSKEESSLQKYVVPLYYKSLEKWNDLSKKDKSLIYFKNRYMDSYRNEWFKVKSVKK